MISGQMIDELLKQMNKAQSFVIMMSRLQSWYFQSLKDNPAITGVVWTPHISLAHFFPDEKSVEEFKMNFISPRKVNILRLNRD